MSGTIFGAFMAGRQGRQQEERNSLYNAGMQQQQQDDQAFRALGPRLQQRDPQAIIEAATINPRRAAEWQGVVNGMDEQQRTRARGMLDLTAQLGGSLLNLPDSEWDAAWPTVRQQAASLGLALPEAKPTRAQVQQQVSLAVPAAKLFDLDQNRSSVDALIGGAAPAAAPSATPGAALEGATLPRGERNNNPLNIVDGSFTRGLPGYSGSDGRFARYQSPEQGMAAADALLTRYGQAGRNTPLGIISRWAPAAEAGNNPQAYAGYVAERLNVKPDTVLDMTNPQVRQQLAVAMAEFENGRRPGQRAALNQYAGPGAPSAATQAPQPSGSGQPAAGVYAAAGPGAPAAPRYEDPRTLGMSADDEAAEAQLLRRPVPPQPTAPAPAPGAPPGGPAPSAAPLTPSAQASPLFQGLTPEQQQHILAVRRAPGMTGPKLLEMADDYRKVNATAGRQRIEDAYKRERDQVGDARNATTDQRANRTVQLAEATAAQRAIKDQARPLNDGTRGKLNEAGGTISTLDRLNNTFQDDYTAVTGLGGIQNMIGRNTSLGFQDQAQWWQDYAAFANQVRHQLFGAALTATEAGEFDKAMIATNMTPDAIRTNLARQKEIARQGLRRMAGSLAADRFNPEAIAQASGLDQSEFVPGRQSGGPAPGTIEGGYRFRGGNPADPNAWEAVQ